MRAGAGGVCEPVAVLCAGPDVVADSDGVCKPKPTAAGNSLSDLEEQLEAVKATVAQLKPLTPHVDELVCYGPNRFNDQGECVSCGGSWFYDALHDRCLPCAADEGKFLKDDGTCTPVSQCAAGLVESVAPTATSDRECAKAEWVSCKAAFDDGERRTGQYTMHDPDTDRTYTAFCMMR